MKFLRFYNILFVSSKYGEISRASAWLQQLVEHLSGSSLVSFFYLDWDVEHVLYGSM